MKRIAIQVNPQRRSTWQQDALPNCWSSSCRTRRTLLEWYQMGLVLLNSSSEVFISLIFLVFSSFSSSLTSSILAAVFPLPLPRQLLLPTKTIIDCHIWYKYFSSSLVTVSWIEYEMNSECFFISLILFSSRYSNWFSLRNRPSSAPRLRGWLTVSRVIVNVPATADSQIYRSLFWTCA